MSGHGHTWEHASSTVASQDDLTIRRSEDRDREALARLAELDSAPPPHGPHLLAEEGGHLRAALPLAGGAAIADPFRATAPLVALLELRSAQLEATSPSPARAGRSGLRRRGRSAMGEAGLAFAGPLPRR